MWRWSRWYVGDVAEAIALAVTDDRAAGRVYNISALATLTQEQWIRAIGDAAGWRGEIPSLPEEQLPPHLRLGVNYEQDLVLDGSRIRDELGFHEPYSFEDGIRRTIAWEREVRASDALDRLRAEFDAEDDAIQRASADHV